MSQQTLKKFFWRGVNTEGFQSKGHLFAKNKKTVKSALKAKHITVLEIKRGLDFSFFSITNKISHIDITEMLSEFSILISAGIPLAAALRVISNSTRKIAIKALVNDLSQQLENGQLFSEALKTKSDYFNTLAFNLIYAGEQSGNLEHALKEIVEHREKTQAMQKNIKKAFAYPCIVLVVAICVSCAMLIFVIPQFKHLFDNVGARLPLLTQMMIHLSEAIQNHAITLLILPSLIYFLLKMSSRHFQKWHAFLDSLSLKIPVIGKILLASIFSRCFSTLSTLLASGLPLMEALKITASVAENPIYTGAFMAVHEQIKNGEPFNTALNKTNLFPVKIIQMVSIGEESGQLDFMLKKVGHYFEDKVNHDIQQFIQLLEPTLMIILCALVGILVISMYLPIFKLGSIL